MSDRNKRAAWFHCFSGVAGNMALGALIDAGADVVELSEQLATLDIAPFAIDTSPVLRGGISATYANVKVSDEATERDYKTIVKIIESSSLSKLTKGRSLGTFVKLAEVEAALHGKQIDDIHFHEVGSMDSIIDIVGTAIALELLEIDEIQCSPIANGIGLIKSVHGEIPNPPPAVTKLLEDIPTFGRNIDKELTTPTGAALMSSLATSFGPMPAMTITASGFGAGSSEIANTPNATQVIIGTLEETNLDTAGQPVSIVEVTVDDISGELISYAIQRCLEEGAYDAWAAPVQMKKGRPGFVVSAICDQSLTTSISQLLRGETGSFGVRATTWTRWPLAREFTDVEVDGHTIQIKVSEQRAKVEFEDAVRAARALNRPVRDVIGAAEMRYELQKRSK